MNPMTANKLGRVVLMTAILSAACASSAQTISLDSCRNMALANNKTVRMAEEAIRGTGYDRKAAKAAYLPGIDASATYLYNQRSINLLSEDAKLPTMSFNPGTGKFEWNILTDPSGNPILNPDGGGYIPTEVAVIPKEAMSFDTHNIFAGAVTLTQPVFMGGMIKALNDIAKYAEAGAKAARDQVVQDVIFGVDQAYWQVVSLKAKERLADSFVRLVDSLHNSVKAMLDEGVATRSDLLTVEVKLNEARIMQTKVQNGLTLSRMALAQICGMPLRGDFTLTDESLSGAKIRTTPHIPEMNEVYARRSDLEVLRQGINLLEGRERLTRGSMLPKLGVVGAYEFSTPNLNNGFSKKVGGGFTIGAALTIPIWHWGQNYNHYRAAKSATNAQRILLEDLEEKVDLQVTQARFQFDEAYKTYEMTVNNQISARENLRNAEIGFSEGVLTTNDVILAQTAWLQAHSEEIDAEIGIRLCEVYLRKVLGTLNY